MGNQQSSQAAINYWNSGGFHHHQLPTTNAFYHQGDQEELNHFKEHHRGSVTSFHSSSNYDSALEEFSPQSRRHSIFVENTPSQLSAYTKYLYMNNLVNTTSTTTTTATTTIPQTIFTFDTLSVNKENLAPPSPRQLSKSIEIGLTSPRRVDTETASESSSGYNTLSNSSSKTSSAITSLLAANHICCCEKCWCKKKKRNSVSSGRATATTTEISSNSSDDEAEPQDDDADESVFETDKNNNELVLGDKNSWSTNNRNNNNNATTKILKTNIKRRRKKKPLHSTPKTTDKKMASTTTSTASSAASSLTTTLTTTTTSTSSYSMLRNFLGSVKTFYNGINQANLTGAIDVIVVKHEDGSFHCSPFHVRFGKLGVLKAAEKNVDIVVNGQTLDGVQMKLGDAGEAFFLDHDSNVVDNATVFDTDNEEEFSSTSSSSSSDEEENCGVCQKKKEPSPSSESLPIKSSPLSEEKTKPIVTTTTVTTTATTTTTANNFFSDGDITPERQDSRPQSPKSDTELDVFMKRSSSHHSTAAVNVATVQANQWDWQWGELPERHKEEQPAAAITNTAAVTSSSSNVSSLLVSPVSPTIKSETTSNALEAHAKKQLVFPTKDVYLNDVDSSSKTAEMYLYNKPPSIMKSGLTVDESKQQETSTTLLGDIQISLCGTLPPTMSMSTSSTSLNSLTSTDNNTSGVSSIMSSDSYDDFFQQYAVPYDKFLDEMATITQNPNLVLKVNKRYMNWATAAPVILSAVVYQRPLTSDTVTQLMDKNIKQAVTKPAVATTTSSRLGWFSGWSRTKKEQQPATTTSTSSTATTASNTSSAKKHHHHHQPRRHRRSLLLQPEIRKTTRLSSDVIAKLNLQPGPNEIQFSVTTALQGTTRITSHIFLWNHDDKIIISDIDGTITKSDVLGQVLPFFGQDWTQMGVAELYAAIEKNGYKFIYLSARAIGQSEITRSLLSNICQNEQYLPWGPLLISPTSLFTAFHKEVIEKVPEQFKIQCLQDIKSLFPTDHQPFHAGYGNRISDVKSYAAVGIPFSRIFTINPAGEMRHELSRTFLSSYLAQLEYLDQLFPPVITRSSLIASYNQHRDSMSSGNAIDEQQVQQEPQSTLALMLSSAAAQRGSSLNSDYGAFNYWRSDPLPVDCIQDEIERELRESNALAAQMAHVAELKKAKKEAKKAASVSSTATTGATTTTSTTTTTTSSKTTKK